MFTVRAFLALATDRNYELHQMDVHNAFLHGDIDEEVYMKPPPGFFVSIPRLVFRLRKSFSSGPAVLVYKISFFSASLRVCPVSFKLLIIHLSCGLYIFGCSCLCL